jgi:polar amino acid transport system substrate-binding protein
VTSTLQALLSLLIAVGGGIPDARPTPVPTSDLPALRLGMDTRSLPYCFVPGLDYSKEDPHKPPAVTAEQLRHLTGLEVDIMNALARRMGVKPVIVPVDWFDLEAGLLANRYDAILASWTPSERTSADIAASEPYYEWGLLIAARANDDRIHSSADLTGLKVGHFDDPAVVRALMEMGAGLEAHLVSVSGSDGSELFDLLRAGGVDAVIFDSPGVRWRVAHDRAFRVVGEPLNRLGYHVGVRRGDTELLRRVNAGIRSLLTSEEMQAIRRNWEGAP